MNITQWKALVTKRERMDDETYWVLDDIWTQETALFLDDVEGGLQYFEKQANSSELIWLSEVFDDIVAESQNARIVQGLQRCIDRFPSIDKEYNLTNKLKWTVEDLGIPELQHEMAPSRHTQREAEHD